MHSRSIPSSRWKQKTQTKILMDKTLTWTNKARTGHLSRTAALTTTLLQQIYYILPATTLTTQQCKQMMQPYLQTGLAAASYLRSFPQAMVHAPHQHFGLGLTNLHTKQGIMHLLLLIKHDHCANNITGQLIQGSLENMHLELGFSNVSSHYPTMTSIL